MSAEKPNPGDAAPQVDKLVQSTISSQSTCKETNYFPWSYVPLRALELLLADGALTVGGGTFWRVNRFFLRKRP